MGKGVPSLHLPWRGQGTPLAADDVGGEGEGVQVHVGPPAPSFGKMSYSWTQTFWGLLAYIYIGRDAPRDTQVLESPEPQAPSLHRGAQAPPPPDAIASPSSSSLLLLLCLASWSSPRSSSSL